MTIRQRITLLIFLMIVAIGGVGAYAIYQSRSGAAQVKSVTEGVVPSAMASADLVSALKDVQIAAMTMVSAPDENVLRQAVESLAQGKAALTRAIAVQEQDAGSPAQRGLLEQTKEGVAFYFDAIDATVALKSAGKHELANANVFGNVVQYQAELEQIVQTVRIEKNRAKDKAVETLNDHLATTTKTVAIATVIAVAVLSLIGVLLYRRITQPIGRMQRMMTEIARSQDFTRRLPVERMDEIGHSIVAFNGMIEQIRTSSEQLRRKTADIQGMLQNMHQGIVTVVDGMTVHAEYSAFMENILESDDIAGRDVIELLFEDSLTGPDAVAQVDAACRACIGEDLINFEFNEHLLPGELQKRMPDGRVKTLELSWSPIIDDRMTISRLMICIRDVTELRELAVEAGEQRRRLEMIGEILAVERDKLQDFIRSSLAFVGENEKLIRGHDQLAPDHVAQLFRNMHTIKGNARTYGLQQVTNAAHEAEQAYDRMRTGAVAAPGRDLMLADLQRVASAVREYADISEHTLGRSGVDGAARSDRYLVVEKAHIRETLRLLETVNTSSLQELIGAHYALRQTLGQLGSEAIGDTFGDVADVLPSLAAELGKPVPSVKVNDRGLRVPPHLGATLRNVFMHLVRNAIDHGIESPEARGRLGKPEAGRIELDAAVEGQKLVLRLSDDGRGIALHKIRRVAAQRGIVGPQAVLSDAEVAALIFRPGFTTADHVTAVSGRGVGMDAVREFVAREQGAISVEFIDDAAGAEYRAFRIAISFPAVAAAMDDVPMRQAAGPRDVAEAEPVFVDTLRVDA